MPTLWPTAEAEIQVLLVGRTGGRPGGSAFRIPAARLGRRAANGVSVDGRSHPVAAILADDQADMFSDLRSRFKLSDDWIGVKHHCRFAGVFACGSELLVPLEAWIPISSACVCVWHR